MTSLPQSFLNFIGAIARQFHKPQPNTWSQLMAPSYLSEQDQAAIQQVIRQEADASGEGWTLPDSAVLTLAKAIISQINKDHA